jgi:hypothetical protein
MFRRRGVSTTQGTNNPFDPFVKSSALSKKSSRLVQKKEGCLSPPFVYVLGVQGAQ